MRYDTRAHDIALHSAEEKKKQSEIIIFIDVKQQRPWETKCLIRFKSQIDHTIYCCLLRRFLVNKSDKYDDDPRTQRTRHNEEEKRTEKNMAKRL